MSYSKSYGRINWENYPSDTTPINERNLNKIDVSVDEIDNRVISIDTIKATKAEVSSLFSDVAFNEATGVITFTRKNGATVRLDTKLEKIAVNFSYDPVKERLIITLDDGSEQYVDMSSLITQYEFADTDTLSFSVSSDGKLSAIVKEGSILEKHLQPNYLADIKVETAKSNKSATNASQSEAASKISETNSKAHAEAAATSENNSKVSEIAAKESETNSKVSETASKTSETNAKASQTAAKTSETNAKASETAANSSKVSAANAASVATQKAASATEYANKSKSFAVGGTGTRENEDIDNAKYYSEQAQRISEGLKGSLLPMGTILFAALPNTSTAGYMFNISDEFTTTERFKEGTGNVIPAGTNVYYTADGYWDCMAGSPVTGIKGNKENFYRRGNVNITPSNIGALSIEGGVISGGLTIKRDFAGYGNPCVLLQNLQYPNAEVRMGVDQEGANIRMNGVDGTSYELDTINNGLRLYTQKGAKQINADKDLNVSFPGAVKDGGGRTIESRAPISHSSTETTYGVGTTANYGHVKLSDSTSSASAEADGVAATPNAVRQVGNAIAAHKTSGDHDSRYYTESEIDSKLAGKSNTNHAHPYLPLSGGTMTGGGIFSGDGNVYVKAGGYDDWLSNLLNAKISTLASCNKNWNWAGQGGQPSWVWGGEDGTNMYVYNPVNFRVNYAYTSSRANGIENNVSSHFVGINSTPTICSYTHTGNLVNGVINNGGATSRWKNIYCVTGSINTSDRNLKENITNLTDIHAKFFMLLQPVSFLFKDGSSGRTHVGFISQDVETAMSECGMTDLDFAGFCKDVKVLTHLEKDDEGNDIEVEEPILDEAGNPTYIYSLRYEEFIAINTFMIQRLYSKIDDVEKRLNALENK